MAEDGGPRVEPEAAGVPAAVVHLRAVAWVLKAASSAVPAAMSRFKVSKFRHTEARPPRREVSPA